MRDKKRGRWAHYQNLQKFLYIYTWKLYIKRNILFGLLYPKMKDFLTDKSYHSRPQRIKYNNIGQ